MSFALNLIDSKNQIQNSIQSNPINFLFSEFLVNSIFDLGFYFLIVINPVNKKKKKNTPYIRMAVIVAVIFLGDMR